MIEDTSPSHRSDFGHVPSNYTPGEDDLHVSPAGSHQDAVVGAFASHNPQGFTPESVFERSTLIPSDSLAQILTERSTETWFTRYHPWFPIVHEDTIKHGLRYNTPRYQNVLKAITAVVVDDDELSSLQDKQVAKRMRDEVMHHGMTAASLQSIQALLVLTNYYYNRGELFQFWNVLAMCQR